MAKTNEFEIYIEVEAAAAAANTSLDMTDYVDIADNEALEIHAVDITLDPGTALPATAEAIFQLADSNIQAFVSHADRTSLYVHRAGYDSTTMTINEQSSFSDLTPLIVNKTLFCRAENNGSAAPLPHTLRMKGKIVKPSAKDYMALVLTQTGNVA